MWRAFVCATVRLLESVELVAMMSIIVRATKMISAIIITVGKAMPESSASVFANLCREGRRCCAFMVISRSRC